MNAPLPKPPVQVPNLAPLAQARPGQLPLAVALARSCCPWLLAPIYNWEKAAIEPGIDLWQEAMGEVPDQFLSVTVPLWGPFGGTYLFEIVQEPRTGNWRFGYSYRGRFQELSKRAKATAQKTLARLGFTGLVRSYWD